MDWLVERIQIIILILLLLLHGFVCTKRYIKRLRLLVCLIKARVVQCSEKGSFVVQRNEWIYKWIKTLWMAESEIASSILYTNFRKVSVFKRNWRRQTHYLYVGLLFKTEPPHLLTLTAQHNWIWLETMALMWLMHCKDVYILVICSGAIKYNIKHSYGITVNNF